MSTDLALTRPDPTMDHQSLKTMMDQAVRYVDSGLLPSSIKTPQQALIIMAQGRELGIPSTVALRSIVVVNGRPTCSAELMMALVRRTYGQGAMRVSKTDGKSCTVQYRQAGWDGISENTFTIEEAEQAGLFKNPVWRQYPAAMLRARAISSTVKFAFPECITGLYLPEEMGASVKVVDGEVVPDAPTTGPSHGFGCKAIANSRPDACDCELSGSLDDTQEALPPVNWNAAWHMAVKGTRFEDDDTRHKFISYHTQGKHDSLTGFLAAATREESAELLRAIERRITAEAKKAHDRALLIDQLQDAVRQVNDAGGDMEIPDLALLSDDDIRAMLDHANVTIAAIEQLAVPA